MRGLAFIGALAGLLAGGQVMAQTSIDAGKTPQQIFQSDCSPCHKSAQGLYKGASPMLRSFLQQHYMSSRETAQTMADYLAGQDKAAPAAKPTPAAGQRRQARPKTDESKPSSDTKPAETKPAEPAATPAAAPPPSPAAAPPTIAPAEGG